MFNMMYDIGIDKTGCVLDAAEENDIVKRAGAWYSYGDTKLGQGKEMSAQTLEENPELCEEIKQKLYDKFDLGKTTEDSDTENNSENDNDKK
jgi:recombination protein RecA